MQYDEDDIYDAVRYFRKRMIQQLHEALQNELWLLHNIGDVYSMVNVGGKIDKGWKIAYYPLFGTYKDNKWVEFTEPRALIEKPFGNGGIDFREVPVFFLIKQ